MLRSMSPVALVFVAACLGAATSAGAQTVAGAARFDVASVKPNTGPPGPPLMDGRAFRTSGRMTVTNMTVLQMLQVLYHQRDPTMLIEGGPSWINTDRFDIVAEGDPGSDANVPSGQWLPRMGEMAKALLAERFHLETRIEHRQMQVFALVPADAAHPAGKLHATATADCAAAQSDPARRCGLRRIGAGGISGVGVSLDELAQGLSLPFFGLERPVENHSGITGRFDIDVTNDLHGTTTPQDRTARLITMLKEDLGLELHSVPGQRDVLVVDHLDHPTAN